MIQLGQLIMEDKVRDDRLIAAARSYERCRAEVEKQLPSIRQELHRLLNEAGRKEDDELESDSTPERKMSQQDKERYGNITSMRTAIRELLIILHQAWFLLGDVKHQEGNEEQESMLTLQLLRSRIPLMSVRCSVWQSRRYPERDPGGPSPTICLCYRKARRGAERRQDQGCQRPADEGYEKTWWIGVGKRYSFGE